MSSFSGNDENRKFNPDGSDFEFAGTEKNASSSGAEKAGNSDVSDFEYGDASVAGEYDVKESKFFKYGGTSASSDESIGAYYGHETRMDRYAKEEECECYGYETIPEIDYSEVIAVSDLTSGTENVENSESAKAEEPAPAEVRETEQPEEPVTDSDEPSYEEMAESIFGAREESQADESYTSSYFDHIDDDEDDNEEEDEEQAYEPDIEENYNDGNIEYDDPNVAAFNVPYYDETERGAVRAPSHRKTAAVWSIVISAIALTGIIAICVFAIYCDRRKTDPTLVAAYPSTPTKTEATTTTEETTTEAEATATPTPEPTNTPSPTPTPEPTNTTAPKKAPVQAPVVKKAKATATPTPAETTEPNGGDTGSGSGSGDSGSGSDTGSGDSGSGSGDTGSGTGSGDSGSGSGSGDSGSGSGDSGSGSGGSGSGGSGSGSSGGESGGSSNTPADPEANP